MRSLIERFYAGSPLKRILTVVALLLLVSAVSTIYSFYNLASQLKVFNESGPYTEIGFENILEQRGYADVDKSLKNALAGWKTLSELAQKLLQEKRGGKPSSLSAEVASHDQEIIGAVRSFGSLDWKYLLLFASPQLDPLDSVYAESYKKIRSVSRFLAVYQRRFKELYPDENSSFIFAAQVRLARLNDLTSPFLIGKMITVAMDGIALRGLVGLFNDGLLSDAEAAECIELLNSSLTLDKPMRTAMEDEFIFFKHAYGRFYSQAPLAMWILEKYYGEPFAQYQKMIRETFENPEFKLEMNFSTTNPILMIAFPNFRRASLQAKEKTTQKSILLAALSQRLGREFGSLDPWSGQPLKSAQQGDKLIFYSVGPNKIDDSATGDDILLPDGQDI
ncbi:MAG: hypothetical protein CVV41_05985 [Candidatus Riflebacteria bacterium HGW-Riflebacteria-1]|jgi:hypothetical protein|nr:MAG: hypothetical protein CVV41_05985 [Candidatus Riflebacteria bacterium HGW-Riflebacteria-1]